MDFLDPKKQKAHRTRLFIGYGLMAVMLGLITMFLFLRSDGYDVDRKTGKIIKNGLVFVDSHPESARVLLNGEDKGATDLRLDIPAGDYELELRRDGYRSWKRSFSLEGSFVERFAYPFLFPEKLQTSDSQLYAQTPKLVTQSPDRHWLVAQQTGSFTAFDVVDISIQTVPTTVATLPAGLLEPKGAKHDLELVEWSTDNRHVVLKHSHDAGSEFFVLDTEDAGSSVNLTKTFATPFSNVILRDKKFDRYYLYSETAQTLRVAELANGQTAPLLEKVLAVKSHGDDTLVYVTSDGAAEGKALVRVREGSSDYTIRELPAANNYLLDVARFENAWYFAVGSAAEQKTYVYKNPVSAIKRRPDIKPVPVGVLRLTATAESVSFSANARFVAVQSGSQFSVYDAETDRQYRYDTGLQLGTVQRAPWMDGHRLTLVAGDKTVVFDFDGTNKQELSAAVAGSQAFFDRDYQALYNIAPSVTVAGKTALTRTELRVN